ncbi:MAG: cofactor-independent phosphoglycerate mutase [Clostridiales bacterium]|nr:cofactor-independent phosphoglycerate mutase [Clostridiales bacterium]
MKIIILGDGMADLPYKIDAESNKTTVKTPLEEAKTPIFDALAPMSEIGLVKTVPEGMKPGSDIANLSVMGFNPSRYYTGRSPLEAISIGVNMKDSDLALRCNLVTLNGAENFDDKVMIDYSADEISTDDAHTLINDLAKHLRDKGYNLLKDFDDSATGFESFTFYGGVSYRNCLIISNGAHGTDCTPPHDISRKKIGPYLPKGVYGKCFTEMIKVSYEFLSEHPVNIGRIKNFKRPANSIWLWGQGTKPVLGDFYKLTGRRGAVICAVDLIKGIGISAGMKVYEVDGATGNVHTNFRGKAETVLTAIEDGCDFVYLHIEAADESGHHGDRGDKILSIEKIDETTGFIKKRLDASGKSYTLMVLPDHPTPLATMTHSSDPVPYMMFDSQKKLANGIGKYDEKAAKRGLFVESGEALFKRFLDV